MRLDWKKRINAIDALKHPYFRNEPYPAKPSDLPTFEESHELDRRRFRGQKAAPPPAPKGGTVGMGVSGGWGADGIGSGNGGFVLGNNPGGMNRNHYNGNRHPNAPYGAYRNGGPVAPPNERRSTWQREPRPDTRLPPRPPPAEYSSTGWGGGGMDGSRSERPEGLRERDRERLPRSRGVSNGIGSGRDVDTYIPSYGPDPGRRDDRRRWGDRDDRRPNRDRDRLDYDDRGRNGLTHSRSRSPIRERDRDRIREREPLERDRDVYRR